MDVTSHKRKPRKSVILDGLVDLFLSEGFLEFGIEDFASRMKCSKSTLYEIAPSKEQLIAVIVRAFFKRATEQVELTVASHIDPIERLGAYLEAIAYELAPASDVFYADVQEFGPAREIYSQNTAIAARRVHELVQAAQRPDHTINAAFIGAVTAQVMESIQRGEMEALTGLDDAVAYSLLADLVVQGVTSAPKKPIK